MVVEQMTLFQDCFYWCNISWIIPDNVKFSEVMRTSLGNRKREMIQVKLGRRVLGFFYIEDIENRQYKNTLSWSYVNCVGEHSSPTNDPAGLLNKWITDMITKRK